MVCSSYCLFNYIYWHKIFYWFLIITLYLSFIAIISSLWPKVWNSYFHLQEKYRRDQEKLEEEFRKAQQEAVTEGTKQYQEVSNVVYRNQSANWCISWNVWKISEITSTEVSRCVSKIYLNNHMWWKLFSKLLYCSCGKLTSLKSSLLAAS